jgi:hypothetical protein
MKFQVGQNGQFRFFQLIDRKLFAAQSIGKDFLDSFLDLGTFNLMAMYKQVMDNSRKEMREIPYGAYNAT